MYSTFRQKLTRVRKSLTPVDIILIVLLVTCTAYVVYLILFQFDKVYLNSDFINEIVYRRESFLQKTLFPEGFVCGNESFVSRPVLIYWFFYAVTNNFLLSFQLENVCTFLLELVLIYVFCRTLHINKTGTLLGLCLFITVLPGEVRAINFFPINGNVLFAYTVFIILICRINFIEYHTQKANNQGKYLFSLIVATATSAIIGFTSMKLLLVLYIPLIFVDGIKIIWRYITKHEIPPIFIKTFIFSIVLSIIYAVMYVLFTILYGDTIISLEINIATLDQWLSWDVLSSQLQGILQVFGLTGGAALGSIDGISVLLSLCFALFEILAILWLLWFMRREKTHPIVDVFFYWGVTTVFMFVYQVITGTNVLIGRYYFATAILLPILCVFMVYQCSNDRKEKVLAVPIVAVLLGIVGMLTVHAVIDMRNYSSQGQSDIEKVADYLLEHEYRYVTATYWNAGVLTGITNGYVDAQHSVDMDNLTPYYWIIDTRKFEQLHENEVNILLLTDEEEASAFALNGDLSLLLTYEAEKIQEIGIYNLYKVMENPCVLVKEMEEKYNADLPDNVGAIKEITLSNVLFQTQNGVIDEQGVISSNGSAGYLLYGPYAQTKAGTYDISIQYTYDALDNETNAIFDIAVDTSSVSSMELTPSAEKTKATIQDVVFEDGHVFEVRVWIPEGVMMKIYSIEYLKNS